MTSTSWKDFIDTFQHWPRIVTSYSLLNPEWRTKLLTINVTDLCSKSPLCNLSIFSFITITFRMLFSSVGCFGLAIKSRCMYNIWFFFRWCLIGAERTFDYVELTCEESKGHVMRPRCQRPREINQIEAFRALEHLKQFPRHVNMFATFIISNSMWSRRRNMPRLNYKMGFQSVLFQCFIIHNLSPWSLDTLRRGFCHTKSKNSRNLLRAAPLGDWRIWRRFKQRIV